MKLDKLLAIAAPFLATDKTVDGLKAAIAAANDGLPGNVASSKEIEDKRGKDRKARDEQRAKDRAAADKARDEKRDAEDKARDEAREACDAAFGKDRSARDAKFGKDREDDPEGTNDADTMKACDADMEKEAKDEAEAFKKAEDEDYAKAGDPSTPGGNRAAGATAVDAALIDARIAAAADKARTEANELHTALDEVLPVLGKVTFDSAPKAYRAALSHLKIDHAAVPDAGLAAVLKIAKDRAPTAPVHSAADSAGLAAIPGYNRLK